MTNRHERRGRPKGAKGGTAAKSVLVAERINQAVALLRAGRSEQAERLCHEVVRLDDRQPDAHHLLGAVALQRGDVGRALTLFGRAVTLAPDFVEAHASLGTALHRLGRDAEAADAFERSLALRPNHPPTLTKLGVVLAALGRLEDAEAAHRRAIAADPTAATAYNNLGNTLHAAGRLEDAAAAHRQAAALRPGHAEDLNNLAVVLHKLKQWEEAEATFRQAIALRPDSATPWTNLGSLLSDLDRLDEAAGAHERAVALDPNDARARNNLGLVRQAQGDLVAAATCYRQAIVLDPGMAATVLNLGVVFGRPDETAAILAALEQAVAADPTNADILCNLGAMLLSGGRLAEAEARLRDATALHPLHAQTWSNLAYVLLQSGQSEESSAAYRRAVDLAPDDPQKTSNLLLGLQYRLGITAAELDVEHRKWSDRFGVERPSCYANRADPEKKLRIGFISADFRRHPIGFFATRLLEGRDPEAIATIGYCDSAADAVTERLKAVADAWHDIRGMSDADLAERVRADNIDILFDMAGHTAHNRLPCFARKPAPIQITWAGYVGTTGLAAMDYLMADRFHVPEGEDVHYCERVLRMPNGYICYAPPEDAPEVAPLPAAANGFVTFGCFNNPAKINEPLLDAWGEVMKRVPGSRLFLKYGEMEDSVTRERVAGRLARHGIDPARLIFEGRSPHRDLLAAYGRVDVGLDTSPYSGGLTTCEALWMGVPVVTVTGATFAGRHSTSHLSNVGLTETIATDVAGYIETAVALANDRDRLTALRAGLRERTAASPLCDGPRFARDFEAAMRQVWQAWCGLSTNFDPAGKPAKGSPAPTHLIVYWPPGRKMGPSIRYIGRIRVS